MKKSGVLAVVIGAVLASACGPTKTNPTKGYNTSGVAVGSDTKPNIEYVYVDKEIPVIKEVPVEITKEVIVTKEVPVEVPVYINKEVEQNFAQAQVFQISAPSNIKFVEGESSSLELNIRILQGKVAFDSNIEVDIDGVPQDVKIEPLSADVNIAKYKLSWLPKLGLIPVDQSEAEGTITVSLKNLSCVSDIKEEKVSAEKLFSAIKKSKEIPFVVRRTAKNPTLKVVGLEGDRNVGEEKRFTVEVFAPGTYVGNEPELEVTYDMNNVVTSKGAEMNGAFYIRPDDKTTFRVKTAEETWKFSFVYDTKNNPIQASFDKNMKAIVNPDKLLVRTSFQVITPFRTTSDKKMLQFAIKLNPTVVSETVIAVPLAPVVTKAIPTVRPKARPTNLGKTK